MIKKQSIDKDILIFSILTTITVTVWIVLDVYWAMQKTEIPQTIKNHLEPLNPKLDTSVLQNLENKDFFELSEGDVTTAFSTEIEKPNSATPAANP